MSVTTATEATTTATESTENDAPVINTISEAVITFHAAIDAALANVPAIVGEDDGTDEIVAVRRAFGGLSPDEKRSVRMALKERGSILVDEVGTEAAKAAESGDFSEVQKLAGQSKALNTIQREYLSPLKPKSEGGNSSPKAAADPVAAHADLVAQVQLAYAVLLATVPAAADGTATDVAAFTERVGGLITETDQATAATYRAWIDGGMEGTEPEASDLVKAAARISLGRGPKGQGRKPKSATVAEDAAADNSAEAAAEVTEDAATE